MFVRAWLLFSIWYAKCMSLQKGLTLQVRKTKTAIKNVGNQLLAWETNLIPRIILNSVQKIGATTMSGQLY